MARIIAVSKYNLKYFLSLSWILGGLILFVSPLMLGVKNLDAIQTAGILEVYVSFLGLILITSVFNPESDENIRELVQSKEYSLWKLLIVRSVTAMVILGSYIVLYLYFLKQGNCSFEFGKYFFGTFAGCLFIGGISLLLAGITNSVVAGYMAGFAYYILNYGTGSKYLGKFYLFSMMHGSFEEKYVLFCGGMIALAIAITINVKKTP